MAKKKACAAKISVLPKEKQPFKIPNNWFWTDIASINRYSGTAVDPMKFPETIYELYSVPSSANDFPEIISGSEIGSSKQSVIKNDVLLCKINPRINRVWKVSQHTENELLASSEWIVIRNQILNSDYMMFCFRTQFFREYMLSNVSGVGGSLMRAQPKFVKNYPIPIAPVAEQQRIVDRIESIFAKLDEAKEKAQAVVDGFELRKSAILHKAFTGELTAKWRKLHGLDLKNWEYLKIGEFAQVKGGKRLPKGCSLVTQKTDHPYLRIADFGDNTIDKTDLHYITEDVFEQIRSYIIKKEDVYLSIVGTIGRAGVIPEELDGANLTENAARIITNRTKPRYLCLFLSSPQTQENIKSRIRSATLGKLSLLNIKDIDTPLPTVEEQLEIVRIINDLFEKESAAKEAAESVLDQIDTMKKAVLARAFRGELGTNDPTEASAVELLKSML